MKLLSFVMAGLFGFAAAVQWNDPDPLVWMALYVVAAALSLAAAFGRANTAMCWGAVGVFGAVTALQLPALAGARPEAFASWSMRGAEDEAARELFGTLLCLGWTLVLLRRQLRAAS